MPRPAAMFSPLTMQKSTPSSSRSEGSRVSIARRPGAPNTSATKRMRRASPARGPPRGEPRRRRGSPSRSCSARAPGARHARSRRASRASSRRQSPSCRRSVRGRRARARSRRRATAAPVGWTSMREPRMRSFSTTSSIATTVPSTGAYTSVPAGAPTSSDEVAGPWPPGSWYQRRVPEAPPKMRCARRRSSPWFAWVPSGSTPSALALPPWKPMAVTRLWLTGSCRCSESSLAITSGCGRPRRDEPRCACRSGHGGR